MGHAAGARAVRRAVRGASESGVGVLTLHAFSADNWKRPREEVQALMDIFEAHLQSEAAECLSRGIRFSVIGRRDRLPASLVETIERAEVATAAGAKLHLRLAIDYSARESLVGAARLLTFSLTPSGRRAFERYLSHMESLIQAARR